MPPFATKPRVALEELRSKVHGNRKPSEALHLSGQEGQLRPGTGPSTFDR